MFEKSWLVLIHFVNRLVYIRTELAEKRHLILLERHRNRMADRIKKFWRRYFPIPKNWRTRRFARIYAVHIHNKLEFYLRKGPRKKFVEYINHKLKEFRFARQWAIYQKAAVAMQYAWKRYKFEDFKRYAKIVGLWSVCYNRYIQNESKKGKKKKLKKRAK
jgi:hypothetical protein